MAVLNVNLNPSTSVYVEAIGARVGYSSVVAYSDSVRERKRLMWLLCNTLTYERAVELREVFRRLEGFKVEGKISMNTITLEDWIDAYHNGYDIDDIPGNDEQLEKRIALWERCTKLNLIIPKHFSILISVVKHSELGKRLLATQETHIGLCFTK